MCQNDRHWKEAPRRGVAAVEFAIVLPMLVLIIFGSIETSRVLSIHHSLREAAMNGCRIYSLSDKTQVEAEAMVNHSLNEAGIKGYTVSFSPSAKSQITADLQPVTVTISVMHDEVGCDLAGFFTDATFTASVTLPAELPGS
ncbi:TadE family protein [Aporhodopirellula aestuarii]|uniref:Pilus assembly protein n=1 Tax=Aporhodopirellula aestuarii TaxID=2950107 RepID=A0ABT0UAD4_9BACT|nr:TadE/TadG family type IV pilus assembly protein [Aporhodopirellula aestuarii]MCM2373731.1 pilus assembly protein [Aporhodopirellula aestuarii]